MLPPLIKSAPPQKRELELPLKGEVKMELYALEISAYYHDTDEDAYVQFTRIIQPQAT